MTHNLEHVIIHRIATFPEVPEEDRSTLAYIAERSHEGCSFSDALTVVRIIWRLIRS